VLDIIGAGEALRLKFFFRFLPIIPTAYGFGLFSVLDVLLDVSFDAQLSSPATQNSFCRYAWLLRSTVALRRQRSHVRIVSGAPINRLHVFRLPPGPFG
jgi:hypothetical protein